MNDRTQIYTIAPIVPTTRWVVSLCRSGVWRAELEGLEDIVGEGSSERDAITNGVASLLHHITFRVQLGRWTPLVVNRPNDLQ